MSLPKRAAKAARRSRPAEPTAKAAIKAADSASAQAKRLAAEIERGIAEGRLDVVEADALQALMAATCRVYAARAEAGETFAPVARKALSASDVMVTASRLLRAVDLSVFELGMWQSWSGR